MDNEIKVEALDIPIKTEDWNEGDTDDLPLLENVEHKIVDPLKMEDNPDQVSRFMS